MSSRETVRAGRRNRRRGAKGRRHVDARSRARTASSTGEGLASADRSGTAARVGAVRRRSESRRRRAGEALDRRDAARPSVSESSVTRAEAPRLLEYSWGENDMRWELEPLARRHAPHALAQHRSQVRGDGRGGLAHLLRRARPVPGRSPHRPHRRRRRDEVRLATPERRVRQAVRHRSGEPHLHQRDRRKSS